MAAVELETLVRWYNAWEDASSENRSMSQRDRDYFDGKQWTEDELSTLANRNQPPITMNRIALKINALRGHEIKTRRDPVAYPRTSAHEDAAEAITDALRFVADKEHLHPIRARVAKNMAIEGFGGCVVEVEKDGDQVEVRIRHVQSGNMWADPHSHEPDYSDANYKGIVIWMDRDDALATYPKAKDVIESAVEGGGVGMGAFEHEDKPTLWSDTQRKRIKVCEIYYKKAGDWYVSHYTRAGFLVEPQIVAFKDEKGNTVCPLIMRSANIDSENNRYGIVRNMISPQDSINKRESKALHIANNNRVIYTKGAVEDIHYAMSQFARPDGAVEVVDPNVNPNARFEPVPNTDFMQHQFALLESAKREIDQQAPSAPDPAAIAAASGRGELIRQEDSTKSLEWFFDELRNWQLDVYRHIFWRIRQFWRGERWLRVRDDEARKGFRFVGLNRRTTRGQRLQDLLQKEVPFQGALGMSGFDEQEVQGIMQVVGQAQQQGLQEEQVLPQLLQMPAMAQPFTENDVESLDVDIVIEEAQDSAVIQHEQFTKLVSMQKAGADIPMDVILEASQLRNKRQLIEASQERQKQQGEAQQQQEQLQQQLIQQQQQMEQFAQQLEQVKVEAQAQRDLASAENQKALAMKHAAEAGEKTGDASVALDELERLS